MDCHLVPFPSFTRAMSHSVSPDLTVYVLPAGAVVVSRFCVTVAFLAPLLLSLFLNSIDSSTKAIDVPQYLHRFCNERVSIITYIWKVYRANFTI